MITQSFNQLNHPHNPVENTSRAIYQHNSSIIDTDTNSLFLLIIKKTTPSRKQSIHQPTSPKNHDTFRETIPNQEQNQTQIINPYKLSVCKLIRTIIQNQTGQKHINKTSNQSIHHSKSFKLSLHFPNY